MKIDRFIQMFLFIAFFLGMGSSMLSAEVTRDERRFFDFGQKAMKDGLDELAATKFEQLLKTFPATELHDEAAFLLGRARLNQGRWQEAMEILETALPSVSEAWRDSYLVWIGEAQLKGEWAAAAYQTFERLLIQFPKSRSAPDAKYGMARALLLQQRLEEAQSILRELRKEGPGELRGRAALSLGISLYLQKKYDEASSLLTKLAQDERDNVLGYQALYALANLEEARNQKEAARSRFENLVRLDTPEALTVIPSALYRLGQMETGLGNWQEAIVDFEKAFKKSDDVSLKLKCVDELVDAYLSPKVNDPEKLALNLASWSEDYSKSQLGEALNLQLGVLWKRAGKIEKALNAFKKYFEQYPQGRYQDKAHFQLGWAYLDHQEFDAAKEQFQNVIQHSRSPPLILDGWVKLGDISLEEQKYNEAAVSYLKASEVNGVDPYKAEQALYQAASSKLKAGAYLEVFQIQASRDLKFSSGKLGPEFLLLAADVYRKMNEPLKVVEVLKTMVEKYPFGPQIPRGWIEYAEALYVASQFQEAQSVVESFLPKYPKNEGVPRMMLISGRCQERLGQMNRAQEVFEEIVKKHSKSPEAVEAQFWLGSYFDRIKNYAKAQEQFELLVKNSPSHPLAPEAMFFAARAAYQLDPNKNDAARLTDKLVKDYPDSPWVFDSKFLYADLLVEKGKFDEALLLFDDLSKKADFSKPETIDDRILEAMGRRGECLRQLKKYDEAIQMFDQIKNFPKADASLRNQASVELGKTYENMEDYTQALNNYVSPLYNRDPKNTQPSEREFFWICKGGLEAVRILEVQKKWKEAAGLLSRMVEANLPCRKEAQEMLDKLKAEHAVVQ